MDNIIFDTGSSLCYLGAQEYNEFAQEVQKVANCVANKEEGILYCDCDPNGADYDNFPTIGMNVGNSTVQHWFYLRGKDYLFYQPRNRSCALLIAAEKTQRSNMWLMGDPFLRAYYSIYDMETNMIGLVGVA